MSINKSKKIFYLKKLSVIFFHIHHQENFIFLDSIFQVKQSFYLLVLYLHDFLMSAFMN